MKALAGALLPLLLMVAGACDRYPNRLGSCFILGSLGQAFCCVSPGRGVCACVTHPEVWGDTGQGQVLQGFEHWGANKSGKDPAFVCLRNVLMVEAAAWEGKDERKSLIYNSFNPFFYFFFHSAEKLEWGSAVVWGCDYLIYVIRRKSLQEISAVVTMGTSLAQPWRQSPKPPSGSVKRFLPLRVTWVRSPNNRLLTDLVKPYLSCNTSLCQRCDFYLLHEHLHSVLGSLLFFLFLLLPKQKRGSQEAEGDITLSLFSFSIPYAGP